MCGIIAYTGSKQAQPVLLQGLKKLEYRGYDSAGIATLHRKRINTLKSAGNLAALEAKLSSDLKGHCGIGHTRWATHGEANDINAHPHGDKDQLVSIVHNGVIENADELVDELAARNIKRKSETDSELLALLLAEEDGSLLSAMRSVLTRVRGTYGVAAIDRREPENVVIARNGSPIIIGLGHDEMLAASDLAALTTYSKEVIHLDDGEIALLSPKGFEITNLQAAPSSKTATAITCGPQAYEKGHYDHFLQREIHDQPEAVARTMSGRLNPRFSTAHLGGLNLSARELLEFNRVTILGCGSAYYSGLAGANMIETLARLPSDAEPAAEFRYRNPIIQSKTLYIVVSQSGETFDTLAATREIQRKGGFVLGVVNSIGSTIAREVDGGVYMHAGPEVSVASTKTYTSTLTVFALLALMLGRLRDLSPQQGQSLSRSFQLLPELIRDVLAQETKITQIATLFTQSQSAFFLGRTYCYPVALEGAQKMKEISYVHAEAYPISEMKHGPLALISENTPCIILVPDDELLDKSITNLEELKTRKAPIICITDSDDSRLSRISSSIIHLPKVNELTRPMIFGVCLQILAYQVAKLLDRNIDQPRNLAKSVTVE